MARLLHPIELDYVIVAPIDDVAFENVGLLPTGEGELMLSVSAAVRKKVHKNVGDTVRVVLSRRLT